MPNLPKVALVGRANVGKSTLFNRLIEDKKAIVSNIPGTTRDRNYGRVFWQARELEIIDTGGLDLVHDKDFEQDVFAQARYAIDEADLIILVVNVKDGLLPQDKEVNFLLKKNKKNIVVAVNKADAPSAKSHITEFYQLGTDQLYPVSGLNGTGTGDLLDAVLAKLNDKKFKKITEESHDQIRIAIIGKPNVGKSSLINAILEEPRTITSATAYTTRDAQDVELRYKDHDLVLIDTAGVRKHAKIKDRLERYSVSQSLNSIRRADVCLLVTEVNEPMGKQDKHLAEEILNKQKSVIVIANKWDLIPDKDEMTINKFTDYYRGFLPFMTFAPIVFTSALEKQRVKNILDLAISIHAERRREVTDNALDKFLKYIIKKHPPSRGKGTKQPRLHHLKQVKIDPPTFVLTKDFKSDMHDSYIRFIENKLREKFGFEGTPIKIEVKRVIYNL